MLRFLLALLAASTCVAQEIRGPFNVGLPGTSYYDNRFVAVGSDTVEFVSLGAHSGPIYWAYSETAETLVVAPTQICAPPERWYSETYGPVLTTEGWVILEYQYRSGSQFDYGYNRLLLVRGQAGVISTTLLDSGRTHPYWVDSLSHDSENISIRPRLDGGFYTQRRRYFAVRDSSDEWALTNEFETREYGSLFAEPMFREQPCSGTLISGPADSVFFISTYVPEEETVTGCVATRESFFELPTWDNCIIQYYSLLYSRERGLRLLTGYSPLLQLKELRMDGECRQLAEVTAVAQYVVANPNYGYVLLTYDYPDLLLGQLTADGVLVRSPTLLFEEDFFLTDKIVKDNGDICLAWQQYVAPGFLDVHYMIIPWDAVLAAPEQHAPAVPRELSLAAYPNPFNSTVTIRYEVPHAGDVTLTVYDLQGREVATLVNEFVPAGGKELRWTPESLASGVYFISLRTVFANTTHKILYLK